MMKTPFLCLLLFLCGSIHAQQPLPVYSILADTSLDQAFGTADYQLLADPKNDWGFASVSKPPIADRFLLASALGKWKDSAASTWWIRYQLKNSLPRSVKIALSANAEQVDFYVVDSSGGVQHFQTGWLLPRPEKDGLKIDNHIPLVLEPGTLLTVYAKIHERKPLPPTAISPVLAGTERVIDQDYVQALDNTDKFFTIADLQTVYLIGLLTIALLFSLFFYITTREKEFGYFALVLFFLALTRFINPADNYLSVMDPRTDEERLGYLNLFWPLLLLCLVQFVRHFFALPQQYPRLARWMLVTPVILMVYDIICTWQDPNYLLGGSTHLNWNIPYVLLTALICLTVLLVFLLYLGTKRREINLVIVGGFPLVALWGLFPGYMAIYYLVYNVYEVPPGFFRDHTWMLELLFVVWFVVLFSIILFLRFNRLRKENLDHALERAALIEGQKTALEKQVAARTLELQQSLEELKATQKQLVQQEKMASLGELTAGIAHEIQNPLNFVNNFSELNKELLAELQEERAKPVADRDDSLETELLTDIENNSGKINEHGKRADAIVKGMLQHSRASSGKKEPTNINALCDEYLRLSYHGLRAKDKGFQAGFKLDLDPSVDKINVVAQDIGRVLLNLVNNAFYAVNEKRKTAGDGYAPFVTVTTRKTGERVLVSVTDNGSGMPQQIIDKIFQPFFTTKPTGQGTGLGLSLAYDIVKAHGSVLQVSSEPSQGTVFSMLL